MSEYRFEVIIVNPRLRNGKVGNPPKTVWVWANSKHGAAREAMRLDQESKLGRHVISDNGMFAPAPDYRKFIVVGIVE